MKPKILLISLGLCVLVIVLLTINGSYTKKKYDEKLEYETKHLHEWAEKNIGFAYNDISNINIKKKDNTTTNILTGVFRIEEYKDLSFMFDTIKEEMFISITNEEEAKIFESFRKETIGCDFEYKSDDLYVYFYKDITLFKNSKFLFWNINKDETKTESFYNYLSYDDYMLLNTDPCRILHNNEYKINISIDVDNDILDLGCEPEEWILNNKGIDHISIKRSDDNEELRVYKYNEEYKVSYNIKNNYDYSSLIQIKVYENFYESFDEENKVMNKLRDFRKELDEKEYEFDIQINSNGIDIKTNVSEYYLYFSGTKFLEGQKLFYIKGKDEEKKECVFTEERNGKYPYALSTKKRISAEYFYGDSKFVIQ